MHIYIHDYDHDKFGFMNAKMKWTFLKRRKKTIGLMHIHGRVTELASF